MIDFSKLSRPTSAAERARDEQERIARHIEKDLKRRSEWSRRKAILTLTSDAEIRHTMSGDRILHLRGDDDRGRPTSARWYSPDHFEAGAVNALLDQLVEGATVRLDGYWGAREFAGIKRFEFAAQFITVEGGPRTP
jgi:hypothetical protein